MPNQRCQSVIVTAVADDGELAKARARALTLFETNLVSHCTPPGHNFVASFVVFPSGSGVGREANEAPPAPPPKPRTRPCYVCNGFGSRASDEPYMMMYTEPCVTCNGNGKLDMFGRALSDATAATKKL